MSRMCMTNIIFYFFSKLISITLPEEWSPDTTHLTAKELKDAGIRNRTGASGTGNFCHKVILYEGSFL